MNDAPISNPRRVTSRWPEWSVIGLFAAIVAWTIPFHEPWVDEAQAWQLARSLSLVKLFGTYLRYEGSPGLWHLLLWILIRLHVSYAGMHWVCAAIAVGSTALLVLNAPFPRYLTLALPFTFFLLYQYVIVARSYVLVPPLLFFIATYWKKKPIYVSIALGLLANVSLHAACISGGLAIVFLVERLRGGDVKDHRARRRLILCAVIATLFYAFAVWTVRPPADLLNYLTGQPHNGTIFNALALLILPTCQPALVAIPFWAAFILMLGARRSLISLLPVAIFFSFSVFVIANYWHFGLVVPLLICITWISWPKPGVPTGKLEICGRVALCYLAATQMIWSIDAVRFDHSDAFSGDLAAAQLLRPFVDAGDRIALTSLTQPDLHASTAVGILPYFDHGIFLNLQTAFYDWNTRNPTQSLYQQALPSHPRIVVVEAQHSQLGSDFNLHYPRIEQLMQSGYRLTNVFCGSMPFRMERNPIYCHLIFQHTDNAK